MTEEELVEIYEERAAIMEFDGGLSRMEAQRAAYSEWRKIVGSKVKVPKQIQEWYLESKS